MSRTVAAMMVCLILAAGSSAYRALADVVALQRVWSAAAEPLRREMLYGEFAAATQNVREKVLPGEMILLYASIDPALFPYALFPRRIVQAQVEPETNRLFMDLPPPAYQQQSAETLAVDWILWVTPGNLIRGGELVRNPLPARERR